MTTVTPQDMRPRAIAEAVAAVSAVAVDLEVELATVVAVAPPIPFQTFVRVTTCRPLGAQLLADALDLPLTHFGAYAEFGPATWSGYRVAVTFADLDHEISLCQNPIGCDRLGTEPMEAGVFFCDRCCSGAQGSHYDDRDRS